MQAPLSPSASLIKALGGGDLKDMKVHRRKMWTHRFSVSRKHFQTQSNKMKSFLLRRKQSSRMTELCEEDETTYGSQHGGLHCFSCPALFKQDEAWISSRERWDYFKFITKQLTLVWGILNTLNHMKLAQKWPDRSMCPQFTFTITMCIL